MGLPIMKLGNRYKLPHGTGTLLAKQKFDSEGRAYRATEDMENFGTPRWIFMLDSGHTWRHTSARDPADDTGAVEYGAWGDQIEALSHPG